MRTSTVETMAILLSADCEVTQEQREAILAACRAPPARRRVGTVREAAEILACHPGSVKRYAARGLLTPIRITCRRVRYDLGEVERLATQGAAQEVAK